MPGDDERHKCKQGTLLFGVQARDATRERQKIQVWNLGQNERFALVHILKRNTISIRIALD